MTVLAAPGAFPSPAPSKPFPTSYSDDFDSYAINSEANYFADQAGVWEITKAVDSQHGLVMRQKVSHVCHGL